MKINEHCLKGLEMSRNDRNLPRNWLKENWKWLEIAGIG